MVFDYITHTHGLSAHPQKKRTPRRLSIGRILSGEQSILSRAMCSFDSRPLPSKLRGEKLRSALELAARTSSPYESPGIFISIGPRRAAIWTYDLERFNELEGVVPRNILPESALHAPTDGAVLREVLEGYEGQYWLDGELVASRWWSGPVSESEWQVFCLLAERYGASEATLPDPVLPTRRDAVPTNDISLTSQLGLVSFSAWASILAAVFAVFTLYFGLRYAFLTNQTQAMQAQYENLWQEKSVQRSRALALSNLDQKVATLAEFYNLQHPLPGLTAALTAALEGDSQIERIFYDSYAFEVDFVRTDDFAQRDFVANLESSPHVADVSLVQGQRPQLWKLSFTHLGAGAER